MRVLNVVAAVALVCAMLLVLFMPPARAAKDSGEVGRLEDGRVVIVLTSLPEDCDEGMTRLFGAMMGVGPFAGCWAVVGRWVFMEIDGEVMRLEKARFEFRDA